MAKPSDKVSSETTKVFTPNEVAELFMVSPITVRQWAQKGLIDAQTTAGGHRRFTEAAIRAFADSQSIDIAAALDARLGRAGATLLVVDDDRQLNAFLCALFQTQVEGLTVYSAQDGFQAGRLVAEHRPDVVLLDVMMPGIDGVAVCQAIKSDPQTASIRVVGMTGFHSAELENRMLEAGAAALLKKPFDNAEVIEECGFQAVAP